MLFNFFKKTQSNGLRNEKHHRFLPAFLYGNKEEVALILDIGSASVGAALTRIEENKPPHIFFTVRENIPFQGALSSARFLAGVNHALVQVFKKIQIAKKGDIHPARVFCTFSSPWFLLKIRHLQITKMEQFEVTEELMNSLLNEDIQHLKEEMKGTLPLQDIEIIEKKIIQTKLNGYHIQNPYGKKTSNIEIVATVSLSSRRAQSSIRGTLNNFFHIPDFHPGVFPLTAFSALRDMYPYRQDFIFVDITGEATDVSLVQSDLLMGTTSFPYGSNFFIREISIGQKTPQEEAITLFSMYLRGELEEKRHTQVENIIKRSRVEWGRHFRKTLSSLAKIGKFSPALFFTTDAEVAQLFETLMKEASLELFMGEGPDVVYLDTKTMANFISFESGVVRDPFLAIEALFAKKII
ncbi:MAG: cell division FtsA domain-containing protein [Candidatus Yonathbacteria bacterium]|nr:cell division FtsA domain-containing protein [Candidatus Yonathbacteria bacterium]